MEFRLSFAHNLIGTISNIYFRWQIIIHLLSHLNMLHVLICIQILF